LSIVERYGVDRLYTAPTAIRTFMKWGTSTGKHDLVAAPDRNGRRAINPEPGWYWST